MRIEIFKWLLIVPALLFADWLIMILFGSFSGLCHAGNKFFCSVYCYTGITLLSVTVLFVGYLMFKKNFQKK
jgi:hypothetical protein